jgi:hypothetical protein
MYGSGFTADASADARATTARDCYRRTYVRTTSVHVLLI